MNEGSAIVIAGIMVYEEVIKELQEMNDFDIDEIPKIRGFEIVKIILAKLHLLDALIARLTLFGSIESLVPLAIVRAALLDIQSNGFDEPISTDVGSKSARECFRVLKAAFNDFVTIVSKETGKNFVDKRIGKIIKKYKRQKFGKNTHGERDIQKWEH